jgi:hypothetical protein
MKETKKLNKVTHNLFEVGHVMWQGDDSPEAYDTIKRVLKIVNDAGGRLLRLNTYDTIQLTNENRDRESSAGRFLALLD